MREQQLRGEEAELRKKIQEKAKDGTLKVNSSNGDGSRGEAKKRGRWDQTIDEQFVPAKKSASGALTPTWDSDVSLHHLPNVSHPELLSLFDRKHRRTIAGMKLRGTKAAKHLERRPARGSGTRHQHITLRHHRMTRPLRRSRQDATGGTKRRRRSARRPDTTPDGWKRLVLTAELASPSSTPLPEPRSDDRDGTKRRRQPRRR